MGGIESGCGQSCESQLGVEQGGGGGGGDWVGMVLLLLLLQGRQGTGRGQQRREGGGAGRSVDRVRLQEVQPVVATSTIISQERHKSAPYLRLKNSKRTSKCQVFSSTAPEKK